MKSYAVIFDYSFDGEVVVYLFGTYEEAQAFLKTNYEEEMRIDIEENGWDCHGFIEDDCSYARIFNRFTDRTDITTMKIGNVYN